MRLLKKIKQGAPLHTFPVETFNAMVDLLQGITSDGIKIGETASGGLRLELGDGNVQWRPVTVVDVVDEGGGVILVFKRIMALCQSDYFEVDSVPLGATKDAEGNIDAIYFGSQKIPVEECGDDDGEVVIS